VEGFWGDSVGFEQKISNIYFLSLQEFLELQKSSFNSDQV